MRCPKCQNKSCHSLESCGATRFDPDEVAKRYKEGSDQSVVKAAARLVDGGRAGTLSRLEEIAEYAACLGLKKIGLAYCFAVEEDAGIVTDFLRARGFKISSVRCTVGGLAQSEVNEESELPGVSCNPIGQARQLDSDGAELVVTMGLCLGHDILFARHLQADCTTLVVKDRTSNHNPVEAIRWLSERTSG